MVRHYKRKTADTWSIPELYQALHAIENRQLKITEAAKQYGISRATLYRHYAKLTSQGCSVESWHYKKCGGNPILTRMEEAVLADTVRDLLEKHVVTSRDIKRICFEYCTANEIPNRFHFEKRMASDDWYYGFLKRNPELRTLLKSKSEIKMTGHVPAVEIVKSSSAASSGSSAEGHSKKRKQKHPTSAMEEKSIEAPEIKKQKLDVDDRVTSGAQSESEEEETDIESNYELDDEEGEEGEEEEEDEEDDEEEDDEENVEVQEEGVETVEVKEEADEEEQSEEECEDHQPDEADEADETQDLANPGEGNDESESGTDTSSNNESSLIIMNEYEYE